MGGGNALASWCRQADSKAIARIVKDLAAVHSSSSTRILLEIPQPNSLNGKHSWYQTGFSYGVWQGALASHGFEVGISFKHLPASIRILNISHR